MTSGDVESAKHWVSESTRRLVAKQPNLENAKVETGVVAVDGAKATVATVLILAIIKDESQLSFDTVLLQENRQWKVDYRQTLNNLSFLPLGDFLESLKSIGDAVNQELEKQLPLFENEIKSFSEELRKQLEEFRKRLDQPPPGQQGKPGNGRHTI